MDLSQECIDDYASLTSDVGEYVFENGRRYHGYKSGRYPIPNDENEMDREDMKHHFTLLITEGRLHLAPIGPSPETILDVGTGTGIWAIDMADAYPKAKIIATDLSPIQPVWVPPNMVIEIDDAEDEWLYKPNSLDFVHVRYLFFGIRDWPKLLRQAMKALKPGAWIELIEVNVLAQSYDNSLPEKSQILEFYNVMKPLTAMVGIDIDVAAKFKGYLEEAGYDSVQEEIFDLPMGDWPEDRRLKEVGRFQRFQFMGGLQAIGSALLTRVGHWSKEQVEVFLAGIRREANDQTVHLVYKIHFAYGRKPLQASEKSDDNVHRGKPSS